MNIFRYLAREVLVTMSAVSAALLVIIMSGRFIKYLAEAASGALDPGVLFMVMGYRMPGFLQLILPLGLFLGILLAYGRLYLESEMSVLFASGISTQRILLYSMGPAVLVAMLAGWLSLSLTPQGVQRVEQIFRDQDSMTEFDTLQPGRFQSLRNGQRVSYTEQLDSKGRQLQGVFISEVLVGQDRKTTEGISVLVADKGHQEVLPDGTRYLILENGYRYDGNPGQADYRVIQYQRYGVQLPKPKSATAVAEREGLPTADLLGSKDPRRKIELQWRLSIPLLVLIVTVLAVPLARVNPRQGRYLKLLPAVLLYMIYLALLISVRGQLDRGKLPVGLGLWWVHGLFLSIGLLVAFWEPLQLWRRRRAAVEVAHAQT